MPDCWLATTNSYTTSLYSNSASAVVRTQSDTVVYVIEDSHLCEPLLEALSEVVHSIAQAFTAARSAVSQVLDGLLVKIDCIRSESAPREISTITVGTTSNASAVEQKFSKCCNLENVAQLNPQHFQEPSNVAGKDDTEIEDDLCDRLLAKATRLSLQRLSDPSTVTGKNDAEREAELPEPLAIHMSVEERRQDASKRENSQERKESLPMIPAGKALYLQSLTFPV